jgi:hypothetical protein
MPTVLRWGPYRAFFYSNEGGEPAHVHVRSGDMEAKFWLHDVSVAVNAGFPSHEIGDIIAIYGPVATNCWMRNEHFGN